jgi:glutamyl-tRNA reductase
VSAADAASGVSLRPSAIESLRQGLLERHVAFVLLATCNRSELYWLSTTAGAADADVLHLFVEALRRSGVETPVTERAGEAAARHLLRVACGLDSLVLGEVEILGQVRQALHDAPESELLGGVFRAAIRAGRMARAETAIGAGALSVASAAIHSLVARTSLSAPTVLIVGAGETARAAARQIAADQAPSIVVANRTVAKAEALAAEVRGRAVGLDALDAELGRADVVIVASRGETFLVDGPAIARARAIAGDERPVAIVDLSMPRLVDPAVAGVPGVSVIDLADIQGDVEVNRRRRAAEVPKVEAIIDRELQWLATWARHESLRPLIAGLRRKAETLRRSELEQLRLVTPGDADAIERFSRRLVNRLIGIPLEVLEAGHLPLDAEHALYLHRLFALDSSGDRA